jgi:hypothetical protein
LLRRPGIRLAVEIAGVIAVGIVAGLLGAAVWGIAAAVVVAAAVEVALLRSGREPRPKKPAPAPEPVPVPRTTASPEPEVDPEDELEAQPEAQSEAQSEAEPVADAGRSWNLWALESDLRASGALGEEQEYLILYLRDHAGPDGRLPPQFDDLVRESFPTVAAAQTR